MPEAARTYRLPETAELIGVSAAALRTWLYRHEKVAPTAERSGVWPEFSTADIALFVVVKELVNFGVPSPEAFEIARDKLLEHPKHRAAFNVWRAGGYSDTDAIISALSDRVLVVTRESGKPEARVKNWGDIAAFHTGARATLLLDLAECIKAVLAKVGAK